MSKVFTITEGLENMGAMKTGGQGSVYKGKRIGEIITAIKLIPTPIINQDGNDKSYKDFMNEVEKLKRVNEEPHPNVVTILSSGVSDTGNFPFIEMEYIEGPDLEDLLKPPHEPVFCIKDVCKIAEQLSNALAHCHKYDVKHGDIKSNNVKFNINTGNYVLLDFGLSVMSDEQRRTSLRHAGAIEFMAPEQNEGHILFETDVYSFGVILFELIAGRVPFPLNDKTESARNTVRLSHMETPIPDMLELRRQHLPVEWSEEKKEHEMHVPAWLTETVYRCLEKDSKDRFADGVALHDHIMHSRNTAVKNDDVLASQLSILKKANHELNTEMTALKEKVKQYESQLSTKDRELEKLALASSYASSEAYDAPVNTVPKRTFIVVLILAIAFAAIAAYSFLGKPGNTGNIENTYAVGNDSLDSITGENLLTEGEITTSTDVPTSEVNERVTEREATLLPTPTGDSAVTTPVDTATKQSAAQEPDGGQEQKAEALPSNRYRVTSKAYFYKSADEDSRTNEYIIPTGNVVVRAIDEKDDFILISFKDDQGNTTRGWIRKNDLSKLN